MSRYQACRTSISLSLVVVLAAAAAVLGPRPAAAVPASIRISGTAGDGVYLRPTPDTSQRPVGWMAEGTSPDYTCFTYGQMVGNVNVWFKVVYGGVAGFYASYYDDSTYSSEADLTARYGIPKCGVAPPPPPPPPPPPSRAATYYSGLGDAGAREARAMRVNRVLTYDARGYDGKWRGPAACTPSAESVQFGGADITRLAGWSIGRLGPIYALKHLRNRGLIEAARRIDYVILYDPGSPGDLRGACDSDSKVQAGDTLRWWLDLNPNGRLIVMAGRDTAVNSHESLQRAYFPKIRAGVAPRTGVRARVLVCNYSLNHYDTFNQHKGLMTSPSRLMTTQGWSSCPQQGGRAVWGWNP